MADSRNPASSSSQPPSAQDPRCEKLIAALTNLRFTATITVPSLAALEDESQDFIRPGKGFFGSPKEEELWREELAAKQLEDEEAARQEARRNRRFRGLHRRFDDLKKGESTEEPSSMSKGIQKSKKPAKPKKSKKSKSFWCYSLWRTGPHLQVSGASGNS